MAKAKSEPNAALSKGATQTNAQGADKDEGAAVATPSPRQRPAQAGRRDEARDMEPLTGSMATVEEQPEEGGESPGVCSAAGWGGYGAGLGQQGVLDSCPDIVIHDLNCV